MIFFSAADTASKPWLALTLTNIFEGLTSYTIYISYLLCKAIVALHFLVIAAGKSLYAGVNDFKIGAVFHHYVPHLRRCQIYVFLPSLFTARQ